jgi:hypothetical protein
MWGAVADIWTVETAMIASGGFMLFLPLVVVFLPLLEGSPAEAEPIQLRNTPETGLALNLRSGPIVVEIDYRVAVSNAREFYNQALTFRALRLRNGGFGWSIARDIADPTIWTERYQCPTWADYLRIRDRQTAADRDAQAAVTRFLVEGEAPTVRRRLERPFGSVRWRAESPDPKGADTGVILP